MANSDKDILITPNSGSSSADPKIEYVGADSSGNDTITVETLYDGTKSTLSFEGSAGQLFSIVNDLTSDPIFSVNDVSGIPSIEVDSDGEIRLAEFSGNVGIGISTPTELLHVDGRIKANNLTLSSLSAQNSEATAVMIDGSGIIGTRELGSNAFNSTSYLTGNQTITLSGDVSGSGTTSIAVTIADDSHNHIISNIDGLQTALDAKLASSSYTAADVLTKIKTVDGSGSGLDADLLDGINSASFLRSDTNDTFSGTLTMSGLLNYRMLQNQSTSNLDICGDASGFSVFYGLSSATSKPSGTDHAVLTQSYSDAWQTQIATDWRTKQMYFRTQENGTWKSWATMWHSDNDGSGSGLDADTLDGLELHTGTNNVANRVVRTDGNGYIQAGWINTISGATASTLTRIYCSQDGYIRYQTPANFGVSISPHINYNTIANTPTLGGGTPYLDLATGDYGTVKVDDDRGVSWAGYAIRDDWVFMANGADTSGIYNDTDNEWAAIFKRNAEVELYHNGALKMETTSSGISVTGNVVATGNVTAYSSDERLKTNITLIENPIEKVKQLNGVEFDWKDNVEELGFTPRVKHETGVIAQNVQSVIPDATPNAPFNEEYLTVQHEKIIPVLIEAIKEQQKQIDDLKQALHEQKEIK